MEIKAISWEMTRKTKIVRDNGVDVLTGAYDEHPDWLAETSGYVRDEPLRVQSR